MKTQRTLIAAGLAALVAPPALAADDVPSVVVTAQSRKQLLQDVPMTMQVLTSRDIDAVGARDLADLNGYIPGLTVDAIEPTQPSVGIRGVQTGDFGIATDSPVGIYVDGVYTGKTGGALMNFVDVQRIEVVKGPQGTLFGRNSAAGAIAITSNEPGKELDAAGRVKLGKFGRANADVMMNLPISDTMAARIVAVRAGSEGWADNTATGKKSGGDKDWATRISLRKDFDAAKVVFAWEHENMEQYGRPAFGVVKNPALPLGGYRGVYDAAYTANFVNPLDAPLANDQQGSEGRRFDGATLRIEAPLTGMTFNSTTAWRRFQTHNLTDNDGGARSDLNLTTQDAKGARSFQQEFKLSGKTAQLDWVGGLSFYRNNEHQVAGAYVTTGTLDMLSRFAGGAPNFARLFGGLAAAGLSGISASSVFPWDETHYSDVRTNSASAYGDTIWHLAPQTNATFGLRYTRDEKRMTWYVPGRVSPQLDDFLNRFGPLAGLNASSFPSNVIFATAGRLASSPVTREKAWTDWSPRLVLDHKLNRDTLLFGSLSRGYQAGGFNVFTPPNPASPTATGRDPSFAPERMTNVEAGAKMALPALNATLNASLFAYKFRNLQDIQLYSVGTLPTYNVVSSDQKAHGLDVDGRIRVSPRVTLFGGFEYIDQTYTRYQRLDAGGTVTLDLGGQPVGTPRLTAMAGVNMNWEAASGRASVNLQGTHATAQRCNSDTAALSCLRTATLKTGTATSKFDLRVGWDSPDARYGVALIVNNLFDQRYVLSLAGQTEQYGAPYSNITPPRTIGIEFRASM
ncbi:TonB-dependent receptor plug domain-containing protein [Pseudoduganella sp. FT25W]|uniref:TonB-dependent receptor plug domain-containing protein n=1 Tax=Duganella alba TaxID=2666081 RepID=A0A6L5QLE8_9BURK|nr:TonB-dependent receptor [Duganella alba]MRX10653.1 TonB-dependent receptor plug domain-containing protein [Duganella alba]MRX15728.1 TonB-dependent receptor plug domain-containing protein [Duganella alba]